MSVLDLYDLLGLPLPTELTAEGRELARELGLDPDDPATAAQVLVYLAEQLRA